MAPFWTLITRLGEAQLLLPLMLLAVLWLLLQRAPAQAALGWLAATVLAAGLTTASKVAFIGYGWGLPALDFTGFSGHAMFAAAIWPPLLRLAAAAWWPAQPRRGVLAGGALAVLVAVSRVQVGAHSWSEVLAGLLVLGVAWAPASRTHDWVTRLALASSGRSVPFQRWAPPPLPAARPAPAPAVARPQLAAPSLQPR